MKKAIVGISLVIAAPIVLALAQPISSMRAFQVTCGTTATQIVPPDGNPTMSAFRVWNNSTTLVYLGGGDVNTTTKGMPICTTTASCIAADLPVDGKTGYCRVSAGSQVVTVVSGSL